MGQIPLGSPFGSSRESEREMIGSSLSSFGGFVGSEMGTKTTAKRERDMLPLFELPPRKRFKVLEQQRKEREEQEVEGGTHFPTKHGGDLDPHCSDITNAIRLSPKKLVAKGFKVLEKLKQKRRRQEESLVRAMLPPLPHAAAKHKEAHKVAHQQAGGGDKVKPEGGYGGKKEERHKVRTHLKHDGPALVCTLSKSAGMSPRDNLKTHGSESAREIQVGSSTARHGEPVLQECGAVKQSSSSRHHHHHNKDRKEKHRPKRPLYESRGLGVLPGVVQMAKGLLGAVEKKTVVMNVPHCGREAPASNMEQQRYLPSERICKSLLRSESMDMEATELEMAEVLKSISENPVLLTSKSPTTSILEMPNKTLSHACAIEDRKVEEDSEVIPLNETQMTQNLEHFDASPRLQTLEDEAEHEATLPMDIDTVAATASVVVSTDPLIAETVDQLRVAAEHSSKKEMEVEDDQKLNVLCTQETFSNFELNRPSYPLSNDDGLNVQIIELCNESKFPHTESATILQEAQQPQEDSLNLEIEDVKDDSGMRELTEEQQVSCTSSLLCPDVVLPMDVSDIHLLAEEATMSSPLIDSGSITPAVKKSTCTLSDADILSPQEKLGDDDDFEEQQQQAVDSVLNVESAAVSNLADMELGEEMEEVGAINLGGLAPVKRGENDVVSQEKPQTLLTKRERLIADIDERADKLFKRMFDRERGSEWDDHNGHFLPDMGEDEAVEVDEDPVREMEMELDASLTNVSGEESPKNDNGEVAGQEANTMESASPDVSTFLGDQSLPLVVMTNKSSTIADGRPDMLQEGLDVICQDCSQVQVERILLKNDTSASSLRLKNDKMEGSGNLICKSSKEDINWDEDLDDEVPDFMFGKRSGITQRIKAPGRHFQVSNVEPESVTDEEDDGCDVCQSSDAEPADPIVFCDGCDVAVHANCYGNPLRIGVPEGDWFCAQCQSGNPESRTCCLCPMTEGAMKQTIDGKWAHISCAVFVPEVRPNLLLHTYFFFAATALSQHR